jgi:hypothetical protein
MRLFDRLITPQNNNFVTWLDYFPNSIKEYIEHNYHENVTINNNPLINYNFNTVAYNIVELKCPFIKMFMFYDILPPLDLLINIKNNFPKHVIFVTTCVVEPILYGNEFIISEHPNYDTSNRYLLDYVYYFDSINDINSKVPDILKRKYDVYVENMKLKCRNLILKLTEIMNSENDLQELRLLIDNET